MKCEVCRELMMAYLREELDESKQAEVDDHLAQCVACSKELEGTRKVLSVVDAADDPGIRTLVSDIIARAIEQHASDVHIQPTGEGATVRYRIDGVLHDVMQIPREQGEPVVTRIKRMADMDLLVQKKPQDGRLRVHKDDKDFDLRIATLPTVQGESIVMRILVPPEELPSLDSIGMSAHNRELFEKLLRSPCGIVMVTGPTGCGKTTTLYAALGELNRRDRSIATVEDPVEVIIDGINQVRVNEPAGLGFVVAMRHILRQDPDIIMCGELRDLASAEIAVQAALFGHLVLVALHTNDAAGVLRRFSDMGVERFLIAESVVGALAQRLLRKVCPECREQHTPTHEEVAWLKDAGIDEIPEQLWAGARCEHCRQTGYFGRTTAHEVLVVDEEIMAMLHDDVEMEYIERAAAQKTVPMRHDAAEKVVAGITDAAEAMRIFRHIRYR